MELKIRQALEQRSDKLCVLSTADTHGVTESAVVGYVLKDNLTLLISSNLSSRKVTNLLKNNHASIVVGVSFSDMYIQMDGTARVISEGQEYKELDTYFFTQNPNAEKFKTSESVIIEFTPTWVRYIDHSSISSPSEEKTLI